jgi:hypothetical protein
MSLEAADRALVALYKSFKRDHPDFHDPDMSDHAIRNGFIRACVAAGMSLDDPVEIAPGEFKPLGEITADKDMDEAIRLVEIKRAELTAEMERSGQAIRLMEKYGVDTLGDISVDVLQRESAELRAKLNERR